MRSATPYSCSVPSWLKPLRVWAPQAAVARLGKANLDLRSATAPDKLNADLVNAYLERNAA